jgi:hypothetical protein
MGVPTWTRERMSVFLVQSSIIQLNEEEEQKTKRD